MFSQTTPQPVIHSATLTRRGTKLLVEMIIGVIGLLGILLAQLDVSSSKQNRQLLDNGGVVGSSVSQVTAQINWAELLF